MDTSFDATLSQTNINFRHLRIHPLRGASLAHFYGLLMGVGHANRSSIFYCLRWSPRMAVARALYMP